MIQKRVGFEELQQRTDFIHRHIGPSEADQREMLDALGLDSIDTLINTVVPPAIRSDGALELGESTSEPEPLQALRRIAAKNQAFTSYIGMGYYDCHTPTVILR